MICAHPIVFEHAVLLVVDCIQSLIFLQLRLRLLVMIQSGNYKVSMAVGKAVIQVMARL